MFKFTPEQIAAMSDSQREDYARILSDQMAFRAEDSLFEFYRTIVWPAVEGDRPFVDNWHLRAMAEHLEAVTDGKIRRLLINVPFRTSKSTLVSVAWPAWVWIKNPGFQWLCGSYAENLAVRDSLKMRRVITSPLFLKHWGDKFALSGDQNQKQKYENDKGGYRQSFGFTGGIMGSGGDAVLIDDPHDRQGANSEAERTAALVTLNEGIIPRLNKPATDPIVMIMQRLHAQDASGEVLKAGGWEHLMLPMRAELSRIRTTCIGFRDPRTVEGELLWPERFPEKTVQELEITLGSYGTAGQLQQRPAPAGGGILKVDNFRLWPADKDIPDLFWVGMSLDTAFSEKQQNDPSACTVWGIFEYEKKRHVLLLDAWAEHLSYPNLLERVIADWGARYGGVKNNPLKPSRKPDTIIIEAKASGQSLIQSLRLSNLPVVPHNPGRADKVARANLVAPILEAECVWVLESNRNKGKPRNWVMPFLNECEQFPNSDHDDYVDTFTQMLRYLTDSGELDILSAPNDILEEVDYEREKKTRLRVNPYG